MNATRIFQAAAVLFGLVIIGIIFTADLGLVYRLFGFLYSFPYGDAVGHFTLLGTLSLLVALGFPSRRIAIGPLHPLKTCLILAGLITLEEISQIFLPDRTFSLIDLAANYAGIFLLGEVGGAVRKKAPGRSDS